VEYFHGRDFLVQNKIKYTLCGAAAGAANGLFGAGGGMLLVPLLTRWTKLSEREAFATSISIIAPMCLVSICVYCQTGSLAFQTALPYLIGGFFGGLLGGKLFPHVPTWLLRKSLGILILYGGIRSILW
jgi:hypothetical protein